jgi:hypothetical protein
MKISLSDRIVKLLHPRNETSEPNFNLKNFAKFSDKIKKTTKNSKINTNYVSCLVKT